MQELAIEIGVAVAIYTIIALLGILAGGPSWRGSSDGAKVLGYNAFFRGAAILFGVVFPPFLMFLMITQPPPAERQWEIRLIVVGFVVAGGCMLLEAFRTKITLTPEGIGKVSWYHKPRFFRWEEVASVYRGYLQDWVVRHKDGRRITLSDANLMSPFNWFTEACRERLPPGAYPAEFNKA